MKGPQLSAALVWLLSGLVAAVPAAAGPGRGDGGVPARSPWFYKFDRSLQSTLAQNEKSGRKTRVIIRTRAGAQPGVAAFLGKRARLTSPFALDLVGGLPA